MSACDDGGWRELVRKKWKSGWRHGGMASLAGAGVLYCDGTVRASVPDDPDGGPRPTTTTIRSDGWLAGEVKKGAEGGMAQAMQQQEVVGGRTGDPGAADRTTSTMGDGQGQVEAYTATRARARAVQFPFNDQASQPIAKRR